LLFAPASTFTAHAYQHDRLPYDPAELIPVARVSNTLLGFGVPATMQIGSLAGLFTRVHAQPGKLNWATATGATEFLLVSFLKHAQLDMTKVPYRDTVAPATDLAEGRIQLYLVSLAVLRPHVQAGKVTILAVSNSVRIPDQPEIPTVAEAGFPALAFDGLAGLFATREMSADTRGRIAADVKAVADEEISARLLATGQLMSPGGAADLAASIEAQRATIAAIATEMGIKPAQRSR
jgi:tripartite-type tricarboxylate transporter receptor subunit TctC